MVDSGFMVDTVFLDFSKAFDVASYSVFFCQSSRCWVLVARCLSGLENS